MVTNAKGVLLAPTAGHRDTADQGVKEPTGQILPTRGTGDDSSQGLHTLDPTKPDYFCCPLNIGRHLLGHAMLLNLLFSGLSKRIRRREMLTNLSLSYLMILRDCEVLFAS